MWPNPDKEIAQLKGRVQALELALEQEKNARLADKLDALQKMQAIQESLAGGISGLKTVKREARVPMARSTQEFRNFAEGEEINVA